MATVFVLTEDESRLTTIEAAVNANLVSLGEPTISADDVRVGCIQVGLNAITDRNDEPNAYPGAPTLSIFGEPGSNDTLTFGSALQARITAVAAAYGETEANIHDLALHAGCLVMTGAAPASGYIASFGA